MCGVKYVGKTSGRMRVSHSVLVFVDVKLIRARVCARIQLMAVCVLGVAAWIRDSLNSILTLAAHTR